MQTLAVTLPKADSLGIQFVNAEVLAAFLDLGARGSDFDMTLDGFIAVTGLSKTIAKKLRDKRDKVVSISKFKSDTDRFSYRFVNTGKSLDQTAKVAQGTDLKLVIEKSLSFDVSVDKKAKTTSIRKIDGLKLKLKVLIAEIVAPVTELTVDSNSNKVSVTVDV